MIDKNNPIRVTGSFETLTPLHQSYPNGTKHSEGGKRLTICTRKVKLATGDIIPAYSGNAMRGRMRRTLAGHLLRYLDMTPGSLDIYVAHLLFVGGILTKAANLPAPEDVAEFRRLLPMYSLLGGNVRGVPVEGLTMFRDWICQVAGLPETLKTPDYDHPGKKHPAPKDTVGTASYVQSAGFLREHFLPDVFEKLNEELKKNTNGAQDDDKKGYRGSMPFEVEYVVPGMEFYGNIAAARMANEVELAALRLALETAFPATVEVILGGGAQHGFGVTRFEWYNLSDLPEPAIYLAFLDEHKKENAELLTGKRLITVKAEESPKGKKGKKGDSDAAIPENEESADDV